MPGVDVIGIDPEVRVRANEPLTSGSTRTHEITTNSNESASPFLNRRRFLTVIGSAAFLAACGGDDNSRVGEIHPSPNTTRSPQVGGQAGEVPRTPETPKEDLSWKVFPGEIIGTTPDDITRQWVAQLQWAISNPLELTPDGKTGVEILRELFARTEAGNAWYDEFYKRQDKFLASRTRRPNAMPYLRDDQYLGLTLKQMEATQVQNNPGTNNLLRFSTRITLTAQDKLAGGVMIETPKDWNPLDFRFGKFNAPQKDGALTTKWQLF